MEIVKMYIEYLNAGNVEGIVSLFSKEAIVEDPLGAPAKTGEEIKAFFQQGAGYVKAKQVGEITRAISGEIAFQIELTLTNPKGEFRYFITDVFTLNEEGKISGLKAYWNPKKPN